MTRKQPPKLDNFPYHFAMQTRWDDNDIYGHLNNTVHYRLFDTAVNHFLVTHQMLDFHAGKRIYLVVETSCRYFAELAYPDELIVGLGVSHLGNSSVRYHTALFKQGASLAAAAGEFVHVLVDKNSRKPAAIDENSRNYFNQFMVAAG